MFREMLKKWLRKQQGCTEQDVFSEFHKGLEAIEMFNAAEKFHDKALKPANESASEDDDESFDLPN